MSQQILQVNLKFSIPRADLETAWLDAAQPIADTPGLRWKVWLMNEAENEAGGIKIEGTALNVHAVANLMNNLQKTGYFKTVEMTESIQDDKNATTGDIQAFTFQITCEVNKATAPATSAQKS